MSSLELSPTDTSSMVPKGAAPDAMIDGGDLDCGSGLLLMIRGAFDPVPEGGILEVRSRESSVREDLPAWCRMVGHDLIDQISATAGYTHYFVRKKRSREQSRDLELGGDLETAKDYEWKVRLKWTEAMQAKVLSRNHAFMIGRPLSFNTEDQVLSALEYMLGSIAGCLCMGFVWRLSKLGVVIENLEVSLHAKLDNVLVFLGIEDEGNPGLAQIRGKVYIAMRVDDAQTNEEMSEERLTQIWQETQERSPVLRSLASGVEIDLQVKRV